jgi:hypothetical protein
LSGRVFTLTSNILILLLLGVASWLGFSRLKRTIPAREKSFYQGGVSISIAISSGLKPQPQLQNLQRN